MNRTLLLSIIALLCISSAKSQWLTYTAQNTQGLIGNMVSSITADNNGDLWFATDEGVVKYDAQNNLWPSYSIYDGLADNYVSKVYKTSSNEIWAATNNGVSQYNSQYDNWITYNHNAGFGGQHCKRD